MPDGRLLPSGALLAPMEGVMSPAFVGAANRLKLLDVWMPPFVPVSEGAAPSKAALRRRFEPYEADGQPVVPQILGRDPEAVAVCAKRLAALGYRLLSLNFACPSPAVLRSGNGGALLKSPALAEEIVRRCAQALAGEASLIVKARTGWSSPSECESLLPALRDAGALAFIVHFRTVQEGFKPAAGALARLTKAVRSVEGTPLIGNGDIRSVEDAARTLAECSCAGVAVARGFLADPFLLRRILGREAPALEEGRALFLDAMRGAGGKALAGNVLEVAKEMYGEGSEKFRSLLGVR